MKPAEQLLQAAQRGNTAKVRQLLAAGAPLEATDVNRNTPIMLAAEGGHEETFHALVQAGANLHALAFRQVDLLEKAARGGNVKIVRFLLEQGLPVDGHRPPGSAPAHLGHATPLIEAAFGGHTEVVELLLQAGANRSASSEGKTPLQHAQVMAGECTGSARAPYLAIVQLLGAASGAPAPDAAEQAVARFTHNAQNPAYQHWRLQLTERFGASRPWQPIPDHGLAAGDVYAFTGKKCKPKALEALQDEVAAAGFHLVLTDVWARGDAADLALFPTSDKYAVIAAVGTEGANYQVSTADVIAWLSELERENPVVLRTCGHDAMGGSFPAPLKQTKKLAKQMAAFCPTLLDGDIDTPDDLARILSRSKKFLLRWD